MGLTIALTGLHMGESPQPGFGVLRSLRRTRPDITIVGLAYDVLESGIYADDAPDAVYTLPYPSAGARAFLERFDAIRARHDIRAFIPTLDAEIHPMLALVPELERRGVRTCLPTPEMFARRNKANLPVLLRECGAETPVTLAAHSLPAAQDAAASLGYPVMIKGQYYDAYKVFSAAHLAEKYADLVAHWGLPVLVQSCVAGSEFNVIGLGDGEGGIAASCAVRKTIVSSKGKGYGAIVVRDPVLEETSARIVRHLKWRGPFELEYIKDDRKPVYHLIEMNPRFPAWVDFPSTFGWNLPELLLEHLLGGELRRLPPAPAGKFFIRHCTDLTGDVADMGRLSSTGCLIRNPALLPTVVSS